MLEQVEFAGWTVAVDVEATRSWYGRIDRGAAEVCNCGECQNYLLARRAGLVFPAIVADLFDRLGIDTNRETGLYWKGTTETSGG